MPKVILTKKYSNLKKGTIVNASNSLASKLVSILKVGKLEEKVKK